MAARPVLAAIGMAGAGSTIASCSMFLTKADVATTAVGVGAADEIDKGVAGGGCDDTEVKVVAWATATAEIGTTRPTSSLAA
jgi:dihydropteroate synthase